MIGVRDPDGERAIRAYAGAPRGDRLHVRVRWHSCPFPQLRALVPAGRRLLDIGCGHGLLPVYLAVGRPEATVVGLDIDTLKLEVARTAAAAAGVGATFRSDDIAELDGEPWDAVTIVDVLYLLGEAEARRVMTEAAGRLAPGGTLVIKEIDVRPAWKHQLARAQEIAATRLLRITEGTQVSFLDPAVIVDHLQGMGLSVTTERLDRGRPHPHLAVVGHRVPT